MTGWLQAMPLQTLSLLAQTPSRTLASVLDRRDALDHSLGDSAVNPVSSSQPTRLRGAVADEAGALLASHQSCPSPSGCRG